MRTYTFNWGKLLVVRWLLVGWSLQAIHVLDRSERWFRILLELIILVLLMVPLFILQTSAFGYVIVFLTVHTLFWLLNSTWLVGYREIDQGFKGKGIDSVIRFISGIREDLAGTDLNAILIYGSLCRKKYHDRSDLDLRIIRSKKDALGLFFKAILFRIKATWYYRIPLDLKVVDSLDYLRKEMRQDEMPVVAYCKAGFAITNRGDDFKEVIDNRESFLK